MDHRHGGLHPLPALLGAQIGGAGALGGALGVAGDLLHRALHLGGGGGDQVALLQLLLGAFPSGIGVALQLGGELLQIRDRGDDLAYDLIEVLQHGVEVAAHGAKFVPGTDAGAQGEIAAGGDPAHGVCQPLQPRHDVAADQQVEAEGGQYAEEAEQDHDPEGALVGGVGFPGQGLGQGHARLAHLFGAAIEVDAQPLVGTQAQVLLLCDQGEEVLAVAFQQGGEGRFTGEGLGQGGQVLFELGEIADVAAQHEVLLVPAQLQHQQTLLLLTPGLEFLLQGMDGLTQGAIMAAGRGEAYLLLLGAQGFELAAVLLELAGKGQDVGLLGATVMAGHLGEQAAGLVALGGEGGRGGGIPAQQELPLLQGEGDEVGLHLLGLQHLEIAARLLLREVEHDPHDGGLDPGHQDGGQHEFLFDVHDDLKGQRRWSVYRR